MPKKWGTAQVVTGTEKRREEMFYYRHPRGIIWYIVKGGIIASATVDDLDFDKLIDVDEIKDIDCWTADQNITTLDEFIEFIEK